jgi:hypothetical protein
VFADRDAIVYQAVIEAGLVDPKPISFPTCAAVVQVVPVPVTVAPETAAVPVEYKAVNATAAVPVLVTTESKEGLDIDIGLGPTYLSSGLEPVFCTIKEPRLVFV